MENLTQQIMDVKNQLKKAIGHLEYSYNKIQKIPDDVTQLDDETLETWESFSARFARVADIFLMKYLRTIVLINDAGFRGSLRDFLNQGEKLGIIDNAEIWMQIRGLRNFPAHEYSEENTSQFFRQLKDKCPLLLAIKDIL